MIAGGLARPGRATKYRPLIRQLKMNLEFTGIEIENFKSFGPSQFLTLDGRGLNFLRGKNLASPELSPNGCLIGATLVDCPRDLKQHPQGIPIRELVGKNFWTYSWNTDEDTLQLSWVKRVWKTGHRQVYKVVLSAFPSGRNSNGVRGIRNSSQRGAKFMAPCELVGTYEHPVMLCDGTWKKLGELQPGDSLKSLYRRDADRGKLSWSDNVYKDRRDGSKYYGLTKTISEQQFVCTATNGPQIENTDVHHKDGNKFNHTPTNLVWKNRSQHRADHASERNRLGLSGWKASGIHPRGMLGKHHTAATKQRIAATLSKKRWEQPANHRVISIKKMGIKPVFDMEVAQTHNFVANGVFVHNCGKSTVWDALTWCLYGRTADNLRNPDIKPWAPSKGLTLVNVQMQVDAGPFAVTRTANPNEIAINDHPATQEDVDKLIGISFSTFCQTVLFGQDKPLFFDLTPKAQMQLFADVLDLDRWERYSQAAAERVREELEPELREYLLELSEIEGQQKEVGRALKTAQDEAAAWEKNRQEAVKPLKQELKKEEATLAKLVKQADELNLQYDSAKTMATDARRAMTEANFALEDMRGAEREWCLLEEKYEAISKALTGDKQCPTCGQPLKSDVHLKKQHAQIDKAMRALKYDPKAKSTAEVAYQKHRDALEDFEKRAMALDSERNKTNYALNSASASVSGLKASLARFEQEERPYAAQIAELRRRASKLDGEREDVEEDKVKTEQLIERTKFWIKGFRDIQLSVTEEVLQELELVSNSMLTDVGMSDWQIKYSVEKELKSGDVKRGLDVVILSPHNKGPVKWENWSGGEKQRLKLIGAIALSEVLLNHAGVRVNLQVFDEPMKFLSLDGARDLCAMLADSARSLDKSYWLIDHMMPPSATFASVTTVVKGADGHSMIKEG